MIKQPLPADALPIQIVSWAFSWVCNSYAPYRPVEGPDDLCAARGQPYYLHHGPDATGICRHCHLPYFEHAGRPVGISVEVRLQRIFDSLEKAGYQLTSPADTTSKHAVLDREFLLIVWRAYQGVCDNPFPDVELANDLCPDCAQVRHWHPIPPMPPEEKNRLIGALDALMTQGYRFVK